MQVRASIRPVDIYAAADERIRREFEGRRKVFPMDPAILE
jgi:hypothetical protein